MAESWRIFIVEDEENLNRNIVNSLRKDGYRAQGVTTTAEAMRILWSEEYDIVVCDLKTPGTDGFELLQWLRSYRPQLRVLMVGAIDRDSYHAQVLENGAVGYLERPLDLHLLKEELRRLLQQTGFSANLASFDLLDVIQIVTMSHKSITLLVSTGLEEHGTLRFQGGELVWAEYGMLLGEEAFFALAAHKNGTVIHQAWNEQITPNVTQPLSRLIFQALQYRTKYANMQQQLSGKQIAVTPPSVPLTPLLEDDDTPFQVLTEHMEQENIAPPAIPVAPTREASIQEQSTPPKEWWQQTGKFSGMANGMQGAPRNVRLRPVHTNEATSSAFGADGRNGTNGNSVPATIHKVPATSQRADLPSWLTDQPTATELPAVHPAALTGSTHMPVVPVSSVPLNTSSPFSPFPPSSAEWQPPQPTMKTTEPIGREQKAGTTGGQAKLSKDGVTASLQRIQPPASAEWQPSDETLHSVGKNGPLQSLNSTPAMNDTLPKRSTQERGLHSAISSTGPQRAMRRNYNYPALVTALQTLGYSINGFIAAAVVSLEGQTIAQAAVNDLDISRMCKHFSIILKSILQSIDQGAWGNYQNTIITSEDRHILMRLVIPEKNIFQVLITTREADPAQSLEVMTNVESAISAALR